MSAKRMQSKQQRLYYEQNNKEKVRQDLEEMVKQIKEMEDKQMSRVPFNPHGGSYFN